MLELNLKTLFLIFRFAVANKGCSNKNVTMSGGSKVLSLKHSDINKMLAATSHLGSENVNNQMERYVFKRRLDGVHIINLGNTWEKLMLAARAIAAVKHPQDVRIVHNVDGKSLISILSS